MCKNMYTECSIEHCSQCENRTVDLSCENCNAIKDPRQRQTCEMCASGDIEVSGDGEDIVDWRCKLCEEGYTTSENSKSCICECN